LIRFDSSNNQPFQAITENLFSVAFRILAKRSGESESYVRYAITVPLQAITEDPFVVLSKVKHSLTRNNPFLAPCARQVPWYLMQKKWGK
jgi:hypothetical protein